MQTLLNTQLPRALATEQAADYCAISAALLRRGRTLEGRGIDVPQHTNIGKRVVYLRDDLDAWLEQCRNTTAHSGAA